jgi:hypothetical protein
MILYYMKYFIKKIINEIKFIFDDMHYILFYLLNEKVINNKNNKLKLSFNKKMYLPKK